MRSERKNLGLVVEKIEEKRMKRFFFFLIISFQLSTFPVIIIIIIFLYIFFLSFDLHPKINIFFNKYVIFFLCNYFSFII